MKGGVGSRESEVGRGEAGVTLLELLIAMTAVSLLVMGMVLSLRVALSAMDKSVDRLTTNRRASSVQRILEDQVAGIMPVKALCAAAPDNPLSVVPFFQGDPQAMRFVSAYSMQQGSRGLPMILEFHVIPGENGLGVRLVVNEHIYTGPRSTGAFCGGVLPDETGGMLPVFYPIQTSTSSFVLADKLAYCRFAYRFVSTDPRQQPPLPPAWLVHWPKRLLPNAIRVEMAPLQADSARVQVLTMTMPVHVTKDPMKMDYGY
jgi:hypothetical protein